MLCVKYNKMRNRRLVGMKDYSDSEFFDAPYRGVTSVLNAIFGNKFEKAKWSIFLFSDKKHAYPYGVNLLIKEFRNKEIKQHKEQHECFSI